MYELKTERESSDHLEVHLQKPFMPDSFFYYCLIIPDMEITSIAQ